MTEFHAPDEGAREEDQKAIDSSQSSGKIDWDAKKWKPQDGEENLVRILPAIGKAKYHLKYGKHFIYHGEKDVEAFVCDKEVYGKPCPSCEHFEKLMRDAVTKEDKDRARDFKVQSKGAFNVIDRVEEAQLKKEGKEVGVKLWEAPPVAVWEFVVGMVLGNSKFNNLAGILADTERKIEADPLKGRDLLVFYYPKADPQRKYKIMPDDTTSLGGKKQVARWLDEATELLPENLYPETGYETAHLKTFGTAEQRKELKEKLKEQYQKGKEAPKEKKEEKKAEKPTSDDTQIAEPKEAKDEVDEVAELKKRLAKAEAKVEAEKEEVKEETPDDAEEEVDEVAEMEKRLEEAKARKKAKGKEKAEKEEVPKEEKKEESSSTPEDVAARVKAIQEKHAKENK